MIVNKLEYYWWLITNNEWLAFTILIYVVVGADTKIMKNGGKTRFKRTKIDELMTPKVETILAAVRNLQNGISWIRIIILKWHDSFFIDAL